jgi:hypothetical protein
VQVDDIPVISAFGSSLESVEIGINTEVEFDVSDDVDKFGFVELLVDSSSLEVDLINEAGVDALVSGVAYIFGADANLMDSITFADQLIAKATGSQGNLTPVATKLNLPKRDLRITEVPRRVVVNAKAVTISGQPFAVEASHAITGNAILNIPVKAQLVGGSLRDTIDLDIDEDLRDQKDVLVEAEIVVESQNRLPVDLSMQLIFFDEDVPILTLPKDVNTTIDLNAGETNEEGRSTASTFSQTKISLNSAEASTILNATRYVIVLNVATAPDGRYVQFLTSDDVRLKAFVDFTINTAEID